MPLSAYGQKIKRQNMSKQAWNVIRMCGFINEKYDIIIHIYSLMNYHQVSCLKFLYFIHFFQCQFFTFAQFNRMSYFVLLHFSKCLPLQLHRDDIFHGRFGNYLTILLPNTFHLHKNMYPIHFENQFKNLLHIFSIYHKSLFLFHVAFHFSIRLYSYGHQHIVLFRFHEIFLIRNLPDIFIHLLLYILLCLFYDHLQNRLHKLNHLIIYERLGREVFLIATSLDILIHQRNEVGLFHLFKNYQQNLNKQVYQGLITLLMTGVYRVCILLLLLFYQAKQILSFHFVSFLAFILKIQSHLKVLRFLFQYFCLTTIFMSFKFYSYLENNLQASFYCLNRQNLYSAFLYHSRICLFLINLTGLEVKHPFQEHLDHMQLQAHTGHISFPFFFFFNQKLFNLIFLFIINIIVIEQHQIMIQLFSNSFSQYRNKLYFCALNKPKCFMIHPVLFPKSKGPIIQQYLAEEAVGLASSLNWEIIKGPFWNKKTGQQKQIMPKVNRNQIYMRPIYDQEIKDGTYVHTSLGKGVCYNDGIIFDADQSQSDQDLHKQWQDKLLRESIANSSLTKCKRITQKLYFTKGKVEKIISHVIATGSRYIFINAELKPGQIRNLRKIIQIRLNNERLPKGYGANQDHQNDSETQFESNIDYDSVQENSSSGRRKKIRKKIQIFDRFSIILQIFAQRTTSKLAKLQIELSYLTYLKTRLVRDGSTYSSNLNMFSGDLTRTQQFSLEIISAKQRRALGMMSGQGQSQLQIERRNIKDKQAKIKRQIEEEARLRIVRKQKQNKRFGSIPTIALVGYTNVGKSALMNYLMKKQQVESKDLLFQTLKTTSRQIYLPSGIKVMLLDTIGFITNLPIQMINSFKVTLEDISHADLVIHLRDISNPQNQLQKNSVIKILKQLNFNPDFYEKKMIQIWNKADMISKDEKYSINSESLMISCKTGENIKQLLETIDEKLKIVRNIQTFCVEYNYQKHYQVLQWLRIHINSSHNLNQKHNYQSSENFPNGSVTIEIEIVEMDYWKLLKFIESLGKGKVKVLGRQHQKIIDQKRQNKKLKGMPPKEGW